MTNEITYESIIEYLIANGKFKKQFLMIDTPFEITGVLNFKRNKKVEKVINIKLNKKLDYIRKTYHSGPITKENPCIRKIEGNHIYFRSARLFPVLYLDLWIINELYKGEITLHFDKLFIGYHILGLKQFWEGPISSEYMLTLTHWNNRFRKTIKLECIDKYKTFLENNNER